MSETKLHFTRVRAKEEPLFFDPATDIRRLLPAVAKATLMNLQDIFKEDSDLEADFIYLHKCFCIMQIRLAEDIAPCEEQLNEFFDAINKVRKKSLFLWLQTMTTLLITLYGMFYRRDAKTDKDALKAMMNTAQFVGLCGFMPEQTRSQMRKDAFEAKSLYQLPESCDESGKVVCEETGEIMREVKELAGIFISHSGSGKWKDLAAACDMEFGIDDGKKDDKAMIALGLAYPDYNVGSLTLEVSEDEPARETQEAEKAE